ncbi:MAG: hypothetical protein OCD76_24285, partial [Reichenbachiella sp.]
MAQKKQTLLSGYWAEDIWMVNRKGKIGLQSKKGKEIVPALYDLVLPTILPKFSFIVKDGKLGIYDNESQKEVILKSNFK